MLAQKNLYPCRTSLQRPPLKCALGWVTRQTHNFGVLIAKITKIHQNRFLCNLGPWSQPCGRHQCISPGIDAHHGSLPHLAHRRGLHGIMGVLGMYRVRLGHRTGSKIPSLGLASSGATAIPMPRHNPERPRSIQGLQQFCTMIKAGGSALVLVSRSGDRPSLPTEKFQTKTTKSIMKSNNQLRRRVEPQISIEKRERERKKERERERKRERERTCLQPKPARATRLAQLEHWPHEQIAHTPGSSIKVFGLSWP